MANFSQQISRFSKKAGKNMATVQRKIAFDLSKKVIEETPVESGRAKGNWLPSIGSPSGDTIGVVSESVAIGKVKLVADSISGDKTYYLTNNLPYIRPLEYGHSPQQPAGWVRLAVQRFNSIAKKAAKQVNR